MDKIELNGKQTGMYDTHNGTLTISFTPDELKAQLKPTRKFKKDDKLWFEGIIYEECISGNALIAVKFIEDVGNCIHKMCPESAIAHFPAPTPEPEKAELKEIDIKVFCDPNADTSKILADCINALIRAVKELQGKSK